MAFNGAQDLSEKKRAADADLHSMRARAAYEGNAQELALLAELRDAWGIAPGAPIVVVGQLRPKSLPDNKTI